MSVDEIGSGDVLRALWPIWNAKRETAQRVRQRISAVTKAAIADGYRLDNPAGDALTAALPKGGQKQRHQRALPHREVAAALETVRQSNAQTSTKLAFEFLVLTASRSGEVRLMTWDEVDGGDGLWTVPASRMKAGREHRVLLSGRATEVLAEAEELRQNELVFPSATGRRMSDNTLSKLLRDLGIDAVPDELSRLVRGERSAAGTGRGGTGAHDTEQGGGRLREDGPAGAASGAYGGVERVRGCGIG